MLFFEVVSLSTNIPLQECNDLAVSYITDGNSDLKLLKSDLNKLLLIDQLESDIRIYFHFISFYIFMEGGLSVITDFQGALHACNGEV